MADPGLEAPSGRPGDCVPSPDVDVFREDCEQVVTDILFALAMLDALDVNDGPEVDDAREAVMDELVSAFGPMNLDEREALDIALDAGEKALRGSGSVDFWQALRSARISLSTPEPKSAAPRGGAVKAEPDKPEQAGGVTDER